MRAEDVATAPETTTTTTEAAASVSVDSQTPPRRRSARGTRHARSRSRGVHRRPSRRLGIRITRVLVGTAFMGGGVGLVLRSHWGLVPLDVLHAALADRAGFTLGGGIIAVQALLLALWVPLRIRPGPATLVAAVVPGVTCDLALAVLPDATALPQRGAALAAGGVLFALGVALYLGADLGANPRDGIIQHLRGRGHNPAVVRVLLDLACVVAGGLLLGPVAAVREGVIGPGTILLVVALGPLVLVLTRVFDHTSAPDSAARHDPDPGDPHESGSEPAETAVSPIPTAGEGSHRP